MTIKEQLIDKMREILDKGEGKSESEKVQILVAYAVPFLTKEMDKNNDLFSTYSSFDAMLADFVHANKLLNDYIDKILATTNDYIAKEPLAQLIALHIRNICINAKAYLAYVNKEEDRTC